MSYKLPQETGTPNYALSALACFGLIFGATHSQAAVALFDYAYNIDGVLTVSPGVPAGVNDAGFDYLTGLGSITFSFTTPGSHFAGLLVDHDIDEPINTYFNEFGTTDGAPRAGWSWEIDEPAPVLGDIYAHFAASNSAASLLDNTNRVPATSPG